MISPVPYILEAPAAVVAPDTDDPPVCQEAMKIRFRRWYTPRDKEPQPDMQKRWHAALEAHMFTCEVCQARTAWFRERAKAAVYPNLTVQEMRDA